LAGQLAQHRAEGLFHLLELLLVFVVVRRLPLLVLESHAQCLFFVLRTLQLRRAILDDRPVDAEAQYHGKDDADDRYPEYQRPTADIVDVETSKFVDQAHPASSIPAPASSPCLLCFSFTMKLAWRAGPCVVVSTFTPSGSVSHSERSICRISADTPVLDCATPLTSTCETFAFIPVMTPPSASCH